METTNTEESAIAAPASIGLSSPEAASGRAATLQAKAQNRLPLMVPSVLRDSRMAYSGCFAQLHHGALIGTSNPIDPSIS